MKKIVGEVERMENVNDDNNNVQLQIDETKQMVDGQCHYHHVGYRIRQIDELDTVTTDVARDNERNRRFIDARVVAIEEQLDPWSRHSTNSKWNESKPQS